MDIEKWAWERAENGGSYEEELAKLRREYEADRVAILAGLPTSGTFLLDDYGVDRWYPKGALLPFSGESTNLYDAGKKAFLDGKITLSNLIEQSLTDFYNKEKEPMSTDPKADPSKGVKETTGKPRLDLIPPVIKWALGKVLTFGAKKYAAYNWAKGLNYSDVYAAMDRHLTSWWEGDVYDKESGMSHLWHALTELTFLISYEHYGMGTDDRFKWPVKPYTPRPEPVKPPTVRDYSELIDRVAKGPVGAYPCFDTYVNEHYGPTCGGVSAALCETCRRDAARYYPGPMPSADPI